MIYVLFFSFLVFGALLNRRKKPHGFLVCLILFLFCIIGLRSLDVGPDTPGYVADFLKYSHFTSSEIWNSLKTSKEPLYLLITWLSSCFSGNYAVFLLIWAVFPCLALYTIMRDNLVRSKEYVISVLVFFLIGLYAFFVAGIRQTAALSILLYSYRYLKNVDFFCGFSLARNKNVYMFAICFACAYFIHNSSLLFLFALPLRYVRVRSWFIFLALGGFLLGKFVKLDILTQLASGLFDDRFAIYGNTYESSLSMSGFYMQLLLFLFVFHKRNELVKQDNENGFFMNMMLVGLLFQSMTGLIAEMYRVSFYFGIFSIVIVPRAMNCYASKREINYAYPVGLFFSLIYLFFLSSSNMPVYSSSINF